MWSDSFAMCLAVLGVLTGFFLPVMEPGWAFLFGAAVLLCAGAYMIARWGERRSAARALEERDTASEKRLLDTVNVALARHGSGLKAELHQVVSSGISRGLSDYAQRDALIARGVPLDNPLVRQLAESVRSSAATVAGVIAMSGTGTVTVTGHVPDVGISASKTLLFMPEVSSKDKPRA